MEERQKMICDECPAHGVEVDRRNRQRSDHDKLEVRVDKHHDKIEAVERNIGLIQRDICMIQKNFQAFKKPMYLVGMAMLIQILQWILNTILPLGVVK